MDVDTVLTNPAAYSSADPVVFSQTPAPSGAAAKAPAKWNSKENLIKWARFGVPQLLFLIWIVVLYGNCFGHLNSHCDGSQYSSEMEVTVGPGCIYSSGPLPSQPDQLNACPANGTDTGTLGPVIQPSTYPHWLAPEKTQDTKEKLAPVFHWVIEAHTVPGECASKPATSCLPTRPGECASNPTTVWHPTTSSLPACNGRGACLVHYFSGELFLNLSPAWVHAASFGFLNAQASRLKVNLKDGWEACLPADSSMSNATRDALFPLDRLVQLMFKNAGRRGGYLAREAWHEDWMAYHSHPEDCVADPASVRCMELLPQSWQDKIKEEIAEAGAEGHSHDRFDAVDIRDLTKGAVPLGYKAATEVHTLGVLFTLCLIAIITIGYPRHLRPVIIPRTMFPQKNLVLTGIHHTS